MKTVSILGCGWLGMPLGSRLVELDYRVNGSTTSVEKLEQIRSHGITPYLIDLEKNIIQADFFNVDTLIIAIPPRLKKVGHSKYFKMMEVACCAAVLNVKNVLFISSTSVYPDLNRQVTEADAETDSILLKVENIFRDNTNFRSAIVRFAGLVGPGRHPGKFLSGKAVTHGDTPVNLIHLEDCIRIIIILVQGDYQLTVNGCSDGHPSRKEFYSRVAKLASIEPPTFLERGEQAFKIVDNSLLKTKLGYVFHFPDPMTMTF